MTTTVTMHLGDVRDVTRRLIEQGDTYDLLVTSPPFLALRSYLPPDHPDKHREIGAEPTPAEFLDTLYGLTADWSQLLPDWASICVELGDTMSGSGGAGGDYLNADGLRAGQPTFRQQHGDAWPLAKSMCLIPHGYTIGLAYGRNPLTGEPSPAGQWRVRNVICWARPNPPVGSLGKRDPHKRTGDYKFRPATSYITVACRGTGRYFDLDAVREPVKHPGQTRTRSLSGRSLDRDERSKVDDDSHPAGAPPLDWHTDDHPEDGDWLWRLPTQPYHGSHYATFPVALPRRMILAMCPQRVCTVCGWPSERINGEPQYVKTQATNNPTERGATPGVNGAGSDPTFVHGRANKIPTTIGWTDCGHDAWRTGRVIDPFGGSGTTAVAAALEHRDAVLIDLDARNVDLVDRRLRDTLHVLDQHRTGDTVTWTVDAPLPNSGDQVAGQLTLLDLEATA
jgi:site-specific DNA-methyltransferase (adenine-specific)